LSQKQLQRIVVIEYAVAGRVSVAVSLAGVGGQPRAVPKDLNGTMSLTSPNRVNCNH